MLPRETRDGLRILTGLEIPQHVHGNGGTTTSQPMDVTGIGKLVAQINRRGVLEEFAETRARVSESPRRRFNCKRIERLAGAAELSCVHGRDMKAVRVAPQLSAENF